MSKTEAGKVAGTTPAKEIHVMLDLETLGTKPGCKILSIGAVSFLCAQDIPQTAFSVLLDIKDQESYGLESDPATIAWWGEQSEEAIDATFGGTVELATALFRFETYLLQRVLEVYPELSLADTGWNKNLHIWAKDPEFDCAILGRAYELACIPIPWDFRNTRSVRTLEWLGKQERVSMPEFAGIKHSSIADAVHQAKCVSRVLSYYEIPGA